MTFPETITLDAGLTRGSTITGPFFNSVNSRYYNVLRDGSNLVMFASDDGETWAQAGGLGPAYDNVLAGGPAYMTFYQGNPWIVFVGSAGDLSIVKFNVGLNDWETSIATGFDWQPLQIALLQVLGTNLVIFGSPTQISPTQQAAYSIFSFATLTATDWADCGMDGLVGSYPATFPIGIAEGTNGRVHLIGATVDPIVSPDHVWQQTLYPATNTLIAVDEFNDTARNNDCTLFPVVGFNGQVIVRLSIGGTTGPYFYYVGASADTITFAVVNGPALPNGNCQAVGIMSNQAGPVVIVMDRLTVPGTPAYYMCTFNGATFGAFVLIGQSAALGVFPFPTIQANDQNGTYLMSWRGSVFFWAFAGVVTFRPVPLVIQLYGRQLVPC